MALDTLILNGTSINDEANYALEAIDFTPPPKKPEWAQAADADGADLIRTPLFDNRTVTMTIRVAPQASQDAALEKVGTLVDLLQEAEKNPGGIPLKWTPANSTKTITFYVLTGAITGIPMVNEGNTAGWYVHSPQLVISLTCKPFGYGEEKSTGTTSLLLGEPSLTLTVASVPGDVPAEGRLVVTDTEATGRRYVEWGLENRYYNPATSLLLDSEDMIPVGGAQSTALNELEAYLRSGATHGTIATVLVSEPTTCCTTGVLAHVGTFRIKVRINAILGTGSLISNVHVRFSWQDGEGPFRPNTWQVPVVGGVLSEIDLGLVTVTPTVTGTQKWTGRIEAYSNNGATVDVLHVDYITLIPVEGYGKARGVQSIQPGTVRVFDNFLTGTLSGNLQGRTVPLPAAGKWETAGATTDFTVEAGHVSRATTADTEPRVAVVGPSLTNMQVSLGLRELPFSGGTMGVIARWASPSHFALFFYKAPSEIGIWLVKGGNAQLTNASIPAGLLLSSLTITALEDGSIRGILKSNAGNHELNAYDIQLETGFELASGKGGIYDVNKSSPPEGYIATRYYTGITVTELPSTPYCVRPSSTMQVRSDSALTADGTGTYYGPVPEYRGSRFYVPQAGQANRTSRILVKADRNDLEVADQQEISRAFDARVFYTPRYHVIPR